jgi:hypothetical protein
LDFFLTGAITQKNQRQDRRRYRAKTGDLKKTSGIMLKHTPPVGAGISDVVYSKIFTVLPVLSIIAEWMYNRGV